MAEEIIPVLTVDDETTPFDEGIKTITDPVWTDDFLVKHLSPDEYLVSGTGTYQPFLNLNAGGQSDGIEQGYNTDASPLPLDSGQPNSTNAIHLSDLPIVVIDGVSYYEIRLDVNEPNTSTKQLSLSEFQIFTSGRQATSGDYTGSDVTALNSDFTKVFDLDATTDKTLVLSDDYSGSGRDDYIFFVPVSSVGAATIGSDPFITLFAQFGPTPPENGGFEEFRLRAAPSIDVTKTVLDVDGVPGAHVTSAGDVVHYQITIDNTGNVDLTGVTVLDQIEALTATGATYVSGDTDGDHVLDKTETWVYSASYVVTQADIDTKGGGNGFIDNTATGDTDQTGPDSASASVAIDYDPSIMITKAVSGVTDGDDVDVSLVTDANGAGDIVNYTLDVKNDGNVTLTNVVVTDPNADTGSIHAVLDGDGFNTGDVNQDGELDVGETWHYTAAQTVTQADLDSQGNDSTDGVDNDLDNTGIVVANPIGTTDTVTDNDSAPQPLVYAPAIDVTKTVTAVDSAGNHAADAAGDIIEYGITISNTGNITLDGVTVDDQVEGYTKTSATAVLAAGTAYNIGDTNGDGHFDVGETWSYTASYTLTQEDLNTKGGGNGYLDNTATGDTNLTDPESDSAQVELVYTPHVDLTKYVSTDGETYYDANDPSMLPGNITVQNPVYFKVTIENDGNIDLTNLDIKDTNYTGNVVGVTQTLYANGALTQYALDHNAVLTGDDNHDNILDVTETWTITYTQGFDYGQHVNVADVSTDEGATDMDAAYYYGVLAGPGVRTPGFWSNLGMQFWDGMQGTETKVGPTFADHELTIIDVNHDGKYDVTNGDTYLMIGGVKGLLIGDWNMNGVTDHTAGNDGIMGTSDDYIEDTLFISLDDAKNLINASQKTQAGDGTQMLGRDMVATWLNYLAGNGIGDASDHSSPKHFLQDAIDWMQSFAGKDGNGTILTASKANPDPFIDNLRNETFDTYNKDHVVVKTSSAYWSVPASPIDHSASAMHSALDHYNNTGQTVDGGIHYAMAADNPMDAMMINAAALIA